MNLDLETLTLPLIVIFGIIVLVLMVVVTVVLWLLELIIPVAFLVIGLMTLYALHEVEALDVEKDHWLVFVPIGMFFVGFGLDKVGLLQFHSLSVSALLPPVSFEAMMFLTIIILVIVDIYIGLRGKH